MTDEARDEAIARAARAFRDESHGRSEAAADTRARVLATRRADTQRTTFWLAAAAALVLGLGVPTAWAWSTGRLERWLGSNEHSQNDTAPAGLDPVDGDQPALDHTDTDQPVAGRTVVDRAGSDQAVTDHTDLEHADSDQAVTDPTDAQHADTDSDQAVTDPTVTDHTDTDHTDTDHTDTDHTDTDHAGVDHPDTDGADTDLSVVDHADSDPSSDTDVDADVVDPEERLAFQRADALHTARDASAIDAWDAYLARYPDGRFAIEARYARALCLVRLGRSEEARAALAPFAEGRYGRYREREASALIEALTP